MATSSLGFFLIYPPGNRSILSQARTNIQKCINETENSLHTQHNSPHIKGRSSFRPLPSLPASSYPRSSEPGYNSTNKHPIGVDLDSLIQSGNFTLKVKGLRKDNDDYFPGPFFTFDLRLKGDTTLDEIRVAIKNAGASLTILPMFSLHV